MSATSLKLRAWLPAVLLGLAPFWLLGALRPQFWTPDEPREADIAWHMQSQADRSIPQLANEPFLEKPPLSYWAVAAAQSVLGDSPPASRLPNLLYALIAALAVGMLAARMRGAAAAVIAALVAGSSVLAWHVSSWLAPDAILLAAMAVALTGLYLGYRAPPGWGKACGYTIMHVGAAIGFMGKSAPAWIFPALTLLTLVVWERRWRELVRWELYAGFILQVAAIAPWIIHVRHLPGGGEALRQILWNNTMGRFTHLGGPGADYTQAHRNWPGRYLTELPGSLLPWTPIVIAALARAWQRVRAADGHARDWRFAIAATVPFLALLSVAATARDVYAGPMLPGLGLLAALWATETQRAAGSLALRATGGIIAVMAWLLAATSLGVLYLRMPGANAFASWFAALALAGIGTWVWRQARKADGPVRSIQKQYIGYATAFALGALALLAPIDRLQDLGRLAREIRADTRDSKLALWQPDETTIAMLDYRLRTPYVMLDLPGDAATAIEQSFTGDDGRLRILVKCPNDPLLARLQRGGRVRVVTQYALPHGRRYVLLASTRTHGPLERQNAAAAGHSTGHNAASGQSHPIQHG